MNFSENYERYRVAFEEALARACREMDFRPAVLTESMRYSLLAGGKRVRPVLFFAALEGLGVPFAEETALAVAIECIHTYSLIHDDLPAMDNDDFRRGMPSSHRKFGEGNAILAGDALLSYAFDLLLKEAGRGERHRRAALALSHAAGAEGMVAGQSADLLYGSGEAGEAELVFIHTNKTGRMIAAPLRMAAILAGRHEEPLTAFGERLGMLFQLTDDLLDGDEDKLTALKVYGAVRAEQVADGYAASCRELLANLDFDTEFLAGMVDLVRRRRK